MHKTPTEAAAWLARFVDEATPAGLLEPGECDVGLAVPFTHFAAMEPLARRAGVYLAAQDLSAHDEGAFTGEVSAAMLVDAGVRHAIVGHSERRALHSETDEVVAAKVSAATRNGIVPIVCVGEVRSEREAGAARDVVERQLTAALAHVTIDDGRDLVVAYEPVWAIGTGLTATDDDAQDMAAFVRTTLRAIAGDLADEVRILYGGSMKPSNAAGLLSQPDVDGGLIGGASLDVADLLAIRRAVPS